MHKHTALVLALLLTLVLSLTGCGGGESPGTPTAPIAATTVAAEQPDANSTDSAAPQASATSTAAGAQPTRTRHPLGPTATAAVLHVTSTEPPAIDVCALLAAGGAEAILGKPATPPAATRAPGPLAGGCKWSVATESGSPASVTLFLWSPLPQKPKEFFEGVTGTSSEGYQATPDAGMQLGNESAWFASALTSKLYVATDSYVLDFMGFKIVDRQKVQQLASAVLAKLP